MKPPFVRANDLWVPFPAELLMRLFEAMNKLPRSPELNALATDVEAAVDTLGEVALVLRRATKGKAAQNETP